MKLNITGSVAIAIILINSTVFGQEFSKTDIVKHRIKTITAVDDKGLVKRVNQYDEHGNLVSTGVKTLAGVTKSKELVYNDHHLLAEEKNYNPLGNVHFTHRYSYNAKKQLVKKESLNSDNSVTTTWTYEYDDDGNLIRETQQSTLDGNNYTTYKYRKGRLVEEETTNETLGKEEKITFTYNERDQLEEQKIKSYFTNSTTTIRFIYDSKGRLTRQVETSESGTDGETVYTYDAKGLLSQQIIRSNTDGLTDTTRFQFEFF